jgi:hypothetical protein
MEKSTELGEKYSNAGFLKKSNAGVNLHYRERFKRGLLERVSLISYLTKMENRDCT